MRAIKYFLTFSKILTFCIAGCLLSSTLVNIASAQTVDNPKQFAGIGAAVDPSAPSPTSGSLYYGYQLTNTTYATTRVDFGVSASHGIQINCTTANAYQILWQNSTVALVSSGGLGVSTSNAGATGGCFGAEIGSVVGIHKFKSGIGLSAYFGVRDVKSTIAPNSYGPTFGLLITAK